MTFEDLLVKAHRAIRAATMAGVRPTELFLGPAGFKILADTTTIRATVPTDALIAGKYELLGLRVVEVAEEIGVRAGNSYGE